MKVTNDDDEEEDWCDDDEAHEGIMCVRVLSEAGSDHNLWRTPPLEYFGHESCITHPVQY